MLFHFSYLWSLLHRSHRCSDNHSLLGCHIVYLSKIGLRRQLLYLLLVLRLLKVLHGVHHLLSHGVHRLNWEAANLLLRSMVVVDLMLIIELLLLVVI